MARATCVARKSWLLFEGQVPPIPLRVRHCENGNYVDVPGVLTGFYEIREGTLVEIEPKLGDSLEG